MQLIEQKKKKLLGIQASLCHAKQIIESSFKTNNFYCYKLYNKAIYCIYIYIFIKGIKQINKRVHTRHHLE